MGSIQAPPYEPHYVSSNLRVGLAVASMQYHTSDEGYQLFQGLEHAGYTLHGYGYQSGLTDVSEILSRGDPTTLLLQDKREWVGKTAGRGFDDAERFTNVGELKARPDIFKLTILKDAHCDPIFHRESAEEIGCHAWVTYYHADSVTRYAQYVRRKHLVRTYHSLDSRLVPFYTNKERAGCLLSGAISKAYPLRMELRRGKSVIPEMDILAHPGYHRRGTATPEYLRLLSHYKVSICTCSVYQYALRKIMESVACGCTVITDLPVWDVLPGIDKALVRIPPWPESNATSVSKVVRKCLANYDPERAEHYANIAKIR